MQLSRGLLTYPLLSDRLIRMEYQSLQLRTERLPPSFGKAAFSL